MSRKISVTLMIIVSILFVSSLSAQLPVNSEGKSPFVDVVKNIRASVVNIKVEYTKKLGSANIPFNQDFFKFFFPEPFKIPQQERKSISMGSGFIFKQDGRDVFIITNNHVAEAGKDGEITVTLADKAKYDGEIVGLDPESDLAVIKIKVDKNEKVTIAPLGDSDEIEIGDWAIAIGNPFGQLGLERTVTVGVISAKGRSNLHFGSKSPIFQNYIQTDAAINPGNSGGPLLDLHGQVVGVNTAIRSTTGANSGIGFAVPVKTIKLIIPSLIAEGTYHYPYLGIVSNNNFTVADLAEPLGLPVTYGVLIAEVVPGTAADQAGLRGGDREVEVMGMPVRAGGDIIIAIDGHEIHTYNDLISYLVHETKVGQRVTLTVMRDEERRDIPVTLGERSSE